MRFVACCDNRRNMSVACLHARLSVTDSTCCIDVAVLVCAACIGCVAMLAAADAEIALRFPPLFQNTLRSQNGSNSEAAR